MCFDSAAPANSRATSLLAEASEPGSARGDRGELFSQPEEGVAVAYLRCFQMSLAWLKAVSVRLPVPAGVSARAQFRYALLPLATPP